MPKKKKHEELCNHCGKCCYFKVALGKQAFFSKNHCPFLDLNTKLCTVYKDRFKKNPECLSIKDAIRIKALPNDCPYVEGLEGYQGPIWIED
jgi:uncharacterized cysteine cluster protein YcgN (CxxCxxCC family)